MRKNDIMKAVGQRMSHQQAYSGTGVVEIEDSAALRETIEGLYTTFAKYPLKGMKHMWACPHCVHANDIAMLHAAPLRTIPAENLSRYSSKAITTWGDVDDFKHFLPRLFELMVYDRGQFKEISLFYVLPRLSYGTFNEWPELEQHAVRDFFLAWWGAFLAIFPNIASTDAFLHGFAPYLVDATPFLTALTATDDPATQCHLVEFCGDLGELFGWQAPYWLDTPEIAQQVLAWFVDADVLERLKAAHPVYLATAPEWRDDYPWLPYALDAMLGTDAETR